MDFSFWVSRKRDKFKRALALITLVVQDIDLNSKECFCILNHLIHILSYSL